MITKSLTDTSGGIALMLALTKFFKSKYSLDFIMLRIVNYYSFLTCIFFFISTLVTFYCSYSAPWGVNSVGREIKNKL